MRLLLFAALLLPSPARAELLKVNVYDPENTCVAKLDTKKMSRAEFDKITALYKFLGNPFSHDPLGFLKQRHEIGEMRTLIAKNKKFLESSVRTIPSFRRNRWKKLGEHILTQANVGREKHLAVLAFMESWDPKPLLESEKTEDGLAQSPAVSWINDDSPEKQEQRRKAEEKRILALPLEERATDDLTCDQRLRILSDDSRLEKFSVRFAKFRCGENGDRKTCEEGFLITPGMTKDDREGRRMYLFQWAWYNNSCPFTRGKLKESTYDEAKQGSLEELMRSALSGFSCESDGCGD